MQVAKLTVEEKGAAIAGQGRRSLEHHLSYWILLDQFFDDLTILPLCVCHWGRHVASIKRG